MTAFASYAQNGEDFTVWRALHDVNAGTYIDIGAYDQPEHCHGIALRDPVAVLEAETGHRMEIRVNPEFVRANGVRQLVGSTAKLQSLIGAATEIPVAATLRDMLAGA